jgi:peptidoglycan/LPS O-acetylase OafA/YrhL
MSYVSALTGVRAFAAALVVLHHYCRHWQPSPGPWMNFLESGMLGVSIFFTLSGFLITRTYYDRIVRKQVGFGEYWLKRAARILPVYWVLLAICLTWKSEPILPGQILVNATLTQAFSLKYIWTGIFPAWSLTNEECFYLLAPLVFVALHRLTPSKKKGPGLLSATLFLTAISALFWYAGTLLIQANPGGDFLSHPSYVHPFNIFGRLPEFALGILIALVVRDPRIRKPAPWIREGAFLAFVGLLAFSMGLFAYLEKTITLQRTITAFEYCSVFWLVGLATTFLIYSAVNGGRLASLLFGNPVMDYLGRISFCLYLLQDSYFMNRIFDFMKWTGMDRSNFVLIYLCLTALAAFFYHVVEKPAHTWVMARFVSKSRRSRGRRLVPAYVHAQK